MEIKDISIKYCFSSSGVRRIGDVLIDEKTLPFLSICFPNKGSYTFKFSGNTYNINPGQAIIVPSNVRQVISHNLSGDGEMTFNWIFINIVIDNKYPFDEYFAYPNILSEDISNKLLSLSKDYLSSNSSEDIKNIINNKIFGYQIVNTLLPILTKKNLYSDETIEYCTEYIHKHYLGKITIEELSNYLGISKSSLFDKFNKVLNTSPNQYIENLKLDHAASLLLSTQKHINEIAIECGYQDQLYFSKRFKLKYGVSPTLYFKTSFNL